jgi:ryanodine receptor 2
VSSRLFSLEISLIIFFLLEPDKLDPADEMSWQHYLYSKLGKKEEQMIEETTEKASTDKKGEEKKIEDTVERIVAMAKVLFGLHMVST